MKLGLMHIDQDRRIATIECKEKDIATIVKVFELFDKSVRDIKVINIGKRGGRK